MFFTLIFVLFIVVGTRYLNIHELASVLILYSLVWLIYLKFKSVKLSEYSVALCALVCAIAVYVLEDEAIFRLLPVFISALFFFKFLEATVSNKPFLAQMLRRVPMLDLSDEKLDMIDRSHLYWSVVNGINFILQIVVIFAPLNIWALYTTVGWYTLFASALVVQIIYTRRALKC